MKLSRFKRKNKKHIRKLRRLIEDLQKLEQQLADLKNK